MRKTKIICTLGPASQSEEVLRQMMLAGMDVARFNFSHGSHEEHLAKLNLVKKLRQELGLPVATLLDTKGPEIRLRNFEGGRAELKEGATFTLTCEDILGNDQIASVTYAGITDDISVGSRILIDDGLIELRVNAIQGSRVICTVLNGGTVSNHKGINIPNVKLSIPYISEQDRSDIIFGIEQGFDFIAASFARSADDIQQLRHLLDEQNCQTIKIIAKIENAQGIENIDEILRVADGIMIARGDMGVEIPLEDVPPIQKSLIKKASAVGKYSITATHMLDSMIHHPRPTRAEAADVANAVYDGTSAVMLSGETAAGKYPVEALTIMSTIAERTEQDIDYHSRFLHYHTGQKLNVTTAISHATCSTAYDIEAAAIVTVTMSGNTARMISRYRPEVPIIGCTSDEHTYRQLSLSWGVQPLMIEHKDTSEELFGHAIHVARDHGYIKNGEVVVITAGVPLGITGTTNLLRVHVVGDVLLSARSVNRYQAVGNLCVCKNEKEALLNFKSGDILVIPQTSNQILPLMKRASAIITEQDGLNSHAAIVGMALDIPVLVGAAHATEILANGTTVRVDSEKGLVCSVDPE